MKKTYNSPAIKISEFAVENIVTASGNMETTAVNNTKQALEAKIKENNQKVSAILTF